MEELLTNEEEHLSLSPISSASSHESPLESTSWSELRDTLADSIDSLTEQERTVVSLYYFEELTLKEIGKVLTISESRVCQIHARALLRLRSALQRRGVDTRNA